MCGIIGYVGNKDIVSVLINGLKRLEYRGYDSAGICIADSNKLYLVKKRGNVSEFEKQLNPKEINGSFGIAHTRWATHGEPNDINAHPHTDCKKEIAVVHNGIIENYQSLKKALEKEGHKFSSETDSEIIAHLIEKFYDGDIEDAVINSLKCLEGTFGLAVIHKDWKGIIAARRGSPLEIGIGDNEFLVSSDIVPIMKHTRKATHMNDNEIAFISREGVSVKDFNKKRIDKKVSIIEGEISQIEKKGSSISC